MQDIRTTIDHVQFDIRSCGLLYNQGKYLVSTEKDGTQTLHGGAVQIGETTIDAIIREFFEETSLVVTVSKLIGTIENHFVVHNQAYHQLLFVYELNLVDPTNLQPKSELGCTSEWLAKEQVTQLRPAILNDFIHNPSPTVSHLINQEPAFLNYFSHLKEV